MDLFAGGLPYEVHIGTLHILRLVNRDRHDIGSEKRQTMSLKLNAFEKRDLFTRKMSSSPMHRTIACLCAVIHDEREQLDSYSLLHWFAHVLQTLQVLDTSKFYKNLYLFLQGDSGAT
jgi:hypothetical protein